MNKDWAKINSINRHRKINKVNELQIDLDKKSNEWKSITNSWLKSKRKDKDAYYKPKYNLKEKEFDKAYFDYYHYVHNNFTKEEINKANKKGNQFGTKWFTNRLRKGD